MSTPAQLRTCDIEPQRGTTKKRFGVSVSPLRGFAFMATGSVGSHPRLCYFTTSWFFHNHFFCRQPNDTKLIPTNLVLFGLVWLEKTPRRGSSHIAQGKRSGALGTRTQNTTTPRRGSSIKTAIELRLQRAKFPFISYPNVPFAALTLR